MYVEKGLYRHTFIAFLGYKHGVIKNSLLTLSNTNNFIHNWVDVRNSVSGDFYTGVKGAVENFTYLASFHLKHVRQLPLFVTDTLDIKRFQVAYDSNALIYNVHFEAGYNVKEWLKLAATGDYNIYQLKNELKPWHEPNLRINFRTTYIWKEKILVSLDLFGITNSYARLSGDAQYKIKGIADLNISAEYLLSKHISFWAMLNNIANQKYERWKNYPSYGINGAIGAKFSF